MKKFDAGIHIKTAGTTWLEELAGLAEAGGDALALTKEIYAQAYSNRESLCEPYVNVIAINMAELPTPNAVNSWTSEDFTSALRHNRSDALYNRNLRQLLHVGFKVAAKEGFRFLDSLDTNEATIGKNVTNNLLMKHIFSVFRGSSLHQ